MKRISLTALVLCLILLVACSTEKAEEISEIDEGLIIMYAELQPQSQRITASQAKEIIANGDAIIVDVRRPDEFAGGHIKDAISIPLDEITVLAPTFLTDNNQIILVYCRSGNRSHQATLILLDMGFNIVYDFGGILDWYGEIVVS